MEGTVVFITVLHAEFAYGDIKRLNNTVGELVKAHSDRLIGFAGLDPLPSEDLVADLDRCLKTIGKVYFHNK
jgi:predicted TIM-barrel fold metal-dependent hydrolase